jgi:hypothetical protein
MNPYIGNHWGHPIVPLLAPSIDVTKGQAACLAFFVQGKLLPVLCGDEHLAKSV